MRAYCTHTHTSLHMPNAKQTVTPTEMDAIVQHGTGVQPEHSLGIRFWRRLMDICVQYEIFSCHAGLIRQHRFHVTNLSPLPPSSLPARSLRSRKKTLHFNSKLRSHTHTQRRYSNRISFEPLLMASFGQLFQNVTIRNENIFIFVLLTSDLFGRPTNRCKWPGKWPSNTHQYSCARGYTSTSQYHIVAHFLFKSD